MSEHRSKPNRSSAALLAVLLVLSLALAAFFGVELNRTKNEFKAETERFETELAAGQAEIERLTEA